MHSLLATDRVYPQHPAVLAEFSRGPLVRPTPPAAAPPATTVKSEFRTLFVHDATSARDVRQPWEPLVPRPAHTFVRNIMAKWPLKPDVFDRYLLARYADAFFVCDSIRHGMPLTHANARIPPFHVRNAKSAVSGPFRPQVDAVIANDIAQGWLNPAPPCWQPSHIHHVTAAPKNKDNPDKVRATFAWIVLHMCSGCA